MKWVAVIMFVAASAVSAWGFPWNLPVICLGGWFGGALLARD